MGQVGKETAAVEASIMEESIRKNQPFWLSHFNFMSLLNLPDVLREFGSLRNYFEGKYLGERFVQEVKNARRQCGARNVPECVLRKLHEGKALETVVANQSTSLKSYQMAETGDPKKKQLTGNVRIYRTVNEAMLSFYSKKPISVLQTTSGDFGLLYYTNGSNRGKIDFLRIRRCEEGISVHNGMRYWKWELTKEVLGFEEWEVRDFAVLLPKAGKLTGEDGYTMVSKEWSPAMLDHYEYSCVGMETKEAKKRHPIMSYVNDKWEIIGWEERPVGELEGAI